MRVLAIDPGTTHSAYVIIGEGCEPIKFGKFPNEHLRVALAQGFNPLLEPGTRVVIEMVASYGMAVGKEVFDTCVWVGRFQERCWRAGYDAELVYRSAVKMHHCHTNRAKDGNIIQALVDRFASGEPNRGKGTKAQPGWFHGFAADVWQAYALAVYAADTGAVAA